MESWATRVYGPTPAHALVGRAGVDGASTSPLRRGRRQLSAVPSTLQSMMGTLTAGLLDRFDEDLRAAWVPDALGRVDVGQLLQQEGPSMEPLERISVPKPDGSSLLAPLLSYPMLGTLHRLTEPLRSLSDQVLEPGVCGYRRGAEAGRDYQREFARMHEMTSALSADAAYVLVADVSQFFANVTWPALISKLSKFVDPAAVSVVAHQAEILEANGVHTLPAGYADARLLANLALATADAAIKAPFVRWVDDYRIFCSSEGEAEAELRRLQDGLSEVGLQLNLKKVKILTATEGRATLGRDLTSVYHPDRESPKQVRANLRALFAEAAVHPVVNRRELRFVLPRLAAESDSVAVEWCLDALIEVPWEAPRVADYLSHFMSYEDVQSRVQKLMKKSVEAGNVFVAARLLALSMSRTESNDESLNSWLMAAAVEAKSPTLWSLLLRYLAILGDRNAVLTLTRDPLNARVAVGALGEVGVQVSDALRHRAPATHAVVAGRGGHVPHPQLSSIL